MEFVSFDDVVKNKKTTRGGKRKGLSSLISVSQVFYHEREKPTRITTVRLSEEAMDKARFKIGDRVDLAFSKDEKFLRLKTLDDESRGYKISGAKPTARVGVVRGTWYEGLPLLGNDPNVAKAKALSNDDTIKISVGEIIVELKETVVESYVSSN